MRINATVCYSFCVSISLKQFLGASRENTKNITVQTSGANVANVDVSAFFTLADSIILTSSLSPETADMTGVYITAETDGTVPEFV